jgi:hypothetical protein
MSAGTLAAQAAQAAQRAGDVLGPRSPWALRLKALEMQAQIGSLLDAADRAEHDERALAALRDAEEELVRARAAVALAEAAVPGAVAAERDAQDRARAAAEHARLTAAEEAEASERGQACPEALSALIVARDAAAVVAARAQDRADDAASAREQAEAKLRSARAEAARCKRAAAAARAAADEADPRVAVSAWTLTYDWSSRLAARQLSERDLPTVRALVLQYARACGAADVLRGEERRKIERENAERVTATLVPRAGHPLRPGTAVLRQGARR